MSNRPLPPGYRSLGQLGRGGTATVIRARLSESGTEVALKLPLEATVDQNDTFVTLIRREFSLIGGRRFPGLVRIVGAAFDPPEYLALELCRGSTLDEINRLESIPQALNILSAIAVNLEYLRLQSIIHGDLKPHNIFLPEDWRHAVQQPTFYVKLSDFSLGRRESEPESLRAGLGTVGYMAPETINSGETSHRSDLFALGVVAYQLLTGQHPFITEDADPVRINSRCTEEEPRPIRELRPDVPDGLAELIEQMLAKNQEARPRSAWEVCRELREIGAGYAYDRILSAARVVRTDWSYETNVENFLELPGRDKGNLSLIAEGNVTWLRLLVSSNHRRGNTVYDGHKFRFRDGVYWPSLMRRRALMRFSESGISRRKCLIRCAVVGNREDGCRLSIPFCDEIPTSWESTIHLLRQLISLSTYRRLSSRYGAEAEQRNLFKLAAGLYIQCDQLERAERCAYEAATHLHDSQQTSTARQLLDLVISYGRETGNAFKMRHLLMLQGDLLKETGETEKALATYQEIIDLYAGRESDKLLAETYKDIGDLYKMQQKFSDGLVALKKALSIYRSSNDELEISRTLNNIGNIYWIISNLNEALKNYRVALHIQRRMRARAETASTLSNIGSIYAIKGRLQRSIYIFKLSLEIKKELGNAGEMARTLNNLGYVYHLSGSMTDAIACLQESLAINRRIDSKKEILFNQENLGVLMITVGNLQKSLEYITEGLELAERVEDKPHCAKFHLAMATVYRRMGRFIEADRALTVFDNIMPDIDDRIMIIQAQISRAAIRLAIGDSEKAAELALTAHDEAASVSAKAEQLNALLVLTKIHASTNFTKEALSLADGLSLPRERLLIQFGHLEALLRADMLLQAEPVADAVLPAVAETRNDIENAWMCNLAAEYLLAVGADDRAEQFLKTSLRFAEDAGLIPERITGLALKGKVHMLRSEYEQCYGRYRAALQLCKEMSAKHIAEEDRDFFYKKRTVRFLMAEIKKLNELLGNKKRQTSGPA